MTHAATDPTKKHRHDIGAPDHGPAAGAEVTRGIQGLLLCAIALTVMLVGYLGLAVAGLI